VPRPLSQLQPDRSARHRFGAEVRAARLRLGMSQAALADVIHVHRDLVAKVERAVRRPSEPFAVSCDSALGTSGALAALWQQVAEERSQRVPLSDLGLEMDPARKSRSQSLEIVWAADSTVQAVSAFTRRDLALAGRETEDASAVISVGQTFMDPLRAWVENGRASVTPAVRSGRIGTDGMCEIEEVARVFRGWSDTLGGGLRKKAVIGQLSEVSDLLHRRHPQEIKDRLLRTMSHLAETVAVMYWDSGKQEMAQRYYVLALRSAKDTGDTPFAAKVMASMARQMLYLGHPTDALALVELAQRTSRDQATASTRSMLYTRQAWAHAHLGHLREFYRATAKAEEALSERSPAEDPVWIQYYDHAEFVGTTGGRLLDLAQHTPALADEAARMIELAIVERQAGRLRSSALDQIGLAEARLVQEDFEEALGRGHTAIAEVGRTPSDRVRVKLGEFYRRTEPHGKQPEIQQLREIIHHALAEPGKTR
jgi:transcriptional regulator with XRE-family HTH domain